MLGYLVGVVKISKTDGYALCLISLRKIADRDCALIGLSPLHRVEARACVTSRIVSHTGARSVLELCIKRNYYTQRGDLDGGISVFWLR